jgi:hypothetical protein
MSLSNYEKETIIRFNDDEKTAGVYTCNAKWIRRLDKCCKQYPDNYKIVKVDGYSKTYQVDKNLVTFPRFPAKKKILSEEERQVLRDRLKAVRHNKIT